MYHILVILHYHSRFHKMDTDPKILPSQVIPEPTLDEDNVVETPDNCLISQQLVQDTDSQDFLNHNLENDQLNIVQNNKNDNLSSEELNTINQETDKVEEVSVVARTDSADSSNSCGTGAINKVATDRIGENVENMIVDENGDKTDSTELVKEAEKSKSDQSVSTEVRKGGVAAY